MNVNIGKKTPNASEKVLGTRKGNVSGAGRVSKVRDGEFREMISNLMEPSHPYLLPRTVPTSAGVIFHKPQLSIVKNLSEEPIGVLLVRPAVEPTVRLSERHEQEMVAHVIARTPNKGKVAIVGQLSVSSPIRLAGGGTLYGTIEPNAATSVIEKDGSLKPGRYIYPEMSWNAGAKITVQLKGEYPDGHTSTFTLRRGSGGSTSILDTAEISSAFGILTYDYTAPSDGSGALSLQVSNAGSFSLSEAVRFEGFGVTEGYHYRTYSLWDLLGNQTGSETSRGQYYAAERYSITGFSALLQNTTASQYKSGSLVAAQMPGGSSHLVPHDPQEAYQFIASYNDPKTHSGQLNKGAHWFFTPEKVQDWFFKSTEDLEGERPFLAVAWSGVAANDLANILGLTLDIRMNIELLTTDISLMKFMPTADLSRLMDLYITLVAAHNSLGENPDHRTKIKKIVQDIMSNPYVINGLKLMRETGKVVLPLALAAL